MATKNIIRTILVIILILCFFGAYTISNTVTVQNLFITIFGDKDKADLAQKDLEREFTYFSVMPGAVQYSFSNRSVKPEHAMVAVTYVIDKNYDDIREFYLQEAAKNGWRFISERSVHDWGKDFGGRSIQFSKGEYRLSVEFAGDRTNGWNYSINLSWGF